MFNQQQTNLITPSQWLRKAQGLMSGMASNYDVPRLILGQAISAVAVVLAIAAAVASIAEPAASFIPFAGIVLAYGIMMFASSYVEEEQHFWYWATTAWFGILGIKGFRRFVKMKFPILSFPS